MGTEMETKRQLDTLMLELVSQLPILWCAICNQQELQDLSVLATEMPGRRGQMISFHILAAIQINTTH